MKLLTVASTLALALASTVPSVWGQSKPALTVDVPFAFVARNRSFQPGTYTFSSKQGLIAVSDAKGRDLIVLPVVTSLARSNSDDDHLLAFDKVDGKKILSEIWLPNTAGALVTATRGEHEHDIIRMVSKAKR